MPGGTVTGRGGHPLSAASDTLLARRAGEGDLEAFETLVRRYQLRIYRMCANALGDTHSAHDAAQDTFLTAWRAVSRFREESSFATWLYRIATNRCLKELKRRRPVTGIPPDLAATDGTPDQHYEATERVAAVAAAIRRLPDDQRIALLLRDVEALPYDEIADVLGVTMTAVKSRIYRARLELAQRLVDE